MRPGPRARATRPSTTRISQAANVLNATGRTESFGTGCGPGGYGRSSCVGRGAGAGRAGGVGKRLGGLERELGVDGLEWTTGTGGGSLARLAAGAAVAVLLRCWAVSMAWPRTLV